MRVLFTGASSFTGMWFACGLARAGHDVTATFRKRPDEYDDPVRRHRVERVRAACRSEIGCEFGDPTFMALLDTGPWDLLCHHAAEVTNYRSPDFNVPEALARNTQNVGEICEALKSGAKSLPAVVLTGSVFENDEGAGSEGLPAFSPYGLSKSFTYQILRYEAARAGVRLGKFVIPNPFGPYEDARFTSYLVKTWFARQTAAVSTPLYVRDNIHVSLLANAYVQFVEAVAVNGSTSCRPSGYAESQGAFAQRFAQEMRPRLGLPCLLDLKTRHAFGEPRVRINTDVLDAESLGWDESKAWDETAAYYADLYAGH